MSASSQNVATHEFDVASYQRFWETVPLETLAKYEGKSVALQLGPEGWEIIRAAATLDELCKDLTAAGCDVSKLVFDQVHTEEATAPGIELQ